MTDIVAFLNARLDEDERRYQRLVYSDTHWEMLTTSAHLGSWTYSRQHGISVAVNDAIVDAGLARMRTTLDNWQRDHAKQWLAEVAAKRRILERHSPVLTYGSRACDGCGWDREDGYHVEDIEECPELRDMASVYFEHPDYEQSWSVE